MTIDALILQPNAPDRWERALYAFLAEKERRSGSIRTVQSCARRAKLAARADTASKENG